MSRSSPPSRSSWNSSPQTSRKPASGQLLQELEALSQALYQSQLQQQPPHQPYNDAAPKPQPSRLPTDEQQQQQKPYNFITAQRRSVENSSGRRYSSSPASGFYAGAEDVISHQNPIPLPGLADPNFRPKNRHSMAVPHPENLGKNEDITSSSSSTVGGRIKPRFSISGTGVAAAANTQNAWAQQKKKQDIRSQIDRRLSLQASWRRNTPAAVEEPSPPTPPPEDPAVWPEEEPPSDVSPHHKPADQQNPSENSKKKSVWNWKPLRALSHIGRTRLHCVFSAYVHAIEGLPAMMNGLRLSVHMRKAETKEGAVQTTPSRIFQGIAEFQETLVVKCTLYSNNSSNKGGGHSFSSRFMEKAVIVSVVSPDIDELDFGKHQLELSRLLSDLVDDTNGQIEKDRSWETSLDLTGKAKGAKLVITFHYEVLDKEPSAAASSSGSSTFGSISSRFHGSPPHRSSPSSRNSATSFSLPNSAHGTPRLPTKQAHLAHSPTISEPGDDYNHGLLMDHLSLDEPSPLGGFRNPSRSARIPDLQSSFHHSRFEQPYVSSQDVNKDAPSVIVNTQIEPPKAASDLLPPTSSPRPVDSYSISGSSNPVNQEEEESSDDDAEFSVVEQGMEISEAAALSLSSMNVADDSTSTPERREIIAAQLDRDTLLATSEAQDDNNESDVKKENPQVGNVEKKSDSGDSAAAGNDQYLVETEFHSEEASIGNDHHHPESKFHNEASAGQGQYYPESEIINEAWESPVSDLESDADERDGGDNKRDDDKIVTTDEGSKKDAQVSYQTVMQTLDSLLQGTSAKERLEEDSMLLTSGSSPDLGGGEEEVKENFVIGSTPLSTPDEPRPFTESSSDNVKMSEEVDHDALQDLRMREEEKQLVPQEEEDIDSEADLVAGEFLDMLDLVGDTAKDAYAADKNSESEQDSPRARLLKQFEKESALVFGLDLVEGMQEFSDSRLDDDASSSTKRTLDASHDSHSLSDPSTRRHDFLGIASDTDDRRNAAGREAQSSENLDPTTTMGAARPELPWAAAATQSRRSKTRAKLLEDAETEALMQEWGLNETAFSSPSPSTPNVKQQQQDPPPLGKGLGASVPLKDGGSLRSMSPSHFQANKSSGKLVMQMSKPVVIPAEMGSEAVDILRNMVSMGVDNMAAKAMTAMPLEEIAGRPMEQVAMEGIEAARSRHIKALEGPLAGVAGKELQWNATAKTPSSYMTEEFVSLEDLAPMAMQQIESLALDGLKIQSNVEENEDAPSAIDAFSYGHPMDGMDVDGTHSNVMGVHLYRGSAAQASPPGKDDGTGPMDMAISLDEWMLLDAGLYDEVETNKNAMAIMAAHHVNHQDLAVVDEDRKSRKQNARWGCMGNTVTIAMLVQLRDPLKNNEAVGVPMMAFVQAERMVKPPKLRVGRNVSLKGNTEENEDAKKEEEAPQFKVINVHLAGVKAAAAAGGAEEEEEAPESKRRISIWGNQKQQQTASRWLLANGMSKSAKSQHPLLTSKPSGGATTAPAKLKGAGESLWSISARIRDGGGGNNNNNRWKKPAGAGAAATPPPLISRNPDVIYNRGRRTHQ